MAGGGEHGTEGSGAILAAFLANMGIGAAKLVGFVITGSSSLLAEAIHSVGSGPWRSGCCWWRSPRSWRAR